MNRSSFKLDSNHERHRICKESTCKKPFMADHKSREYCSNKCKQEFNNRKIYNANKVLRDTQQEEIKLSKNMKRENSESIELLDRLQLGPYGSIFLADKLEKAGLNFEAHNERIRVDVAIPAFDLIFGPYKLSRETPNEILIIKIK